jgi:hypothetical protein
MSDERLNIAVKALEEIAMQGCHAASRSTAHNALREIKALDPVLFTVPKSDADKLSDTNNGLSCGMK